jgi:CRISPR/Cas system CSM-associated protein Csm2 small subunit
MINIFNNYNAEESKDNIKSAGAAGIYVPGIHTITDTEIFLYETEWEGTKYLNADIVVTAENGGTLTDSLRAVPKSNQTEATTDLLNYMYNIALVTDKLDALAALKASFGSLPKVKYTDRYKKEHVALSIKVFANCKWKAMTYSEVSGNANGIFTFQRLTLNQVFRFLDNAALSEIKDGKEAGISYAYWADEDFANCKAKAQVQYNKKRDASEEAVLEVIAAYLADGNKLEKSQRESIQSHFDPEYAKQVLSGKATSASAGADDVDDVDADDDDTPSFG